MNSNASLQRVRRHLMAAVLLLCLIGCTETMRAYEGPARPESEVSILRGLYIGHDGVMPFEIDGKPVGVETPQWIQLLPGPHRVVAKCSRYSDDRVGQNVRRIGWTTWKSPEMRFAFKAGKKYGLFKPADGGCAAVYIAEIT